MSWVMLSVKKTNILQILIFGGDFVLVLFKARDSAESAKKGVNQHWKDI